MWNNGYDDSPFKDYEIRKATVKYGITSIGDSAFSGCSGMTELTLPNSVTSIGNYAFSDCSGLEKITVDRGNKRYDSWGNCNSIIETGTNTLIVGCKNSVIPNSVRSIGDCAFYGCSGLTKLTLPNSVRSIGDGAFSGCSGLTELTLPNSVTRIGDCAFYGCTGLTELILPNSVSSIGDIAFTYCSGLEKITVESGNSCYDSRDNCNSIIDTETNTLIVGCKNSIIPNSVTSIGESAFQGCSGLTKLTLPNSVTSIGVEAFRGCTGLTELTLPNSVKSIGNYSFSGCTGLTELTLPNSLESIGNNAFGWCSELTELTLPNSVTSIGESAFKGCSGLTELTLPNSVTSIGTGTFADCSGMTELTLPNGVTSIEESAFQGCSGLAKITSLAEIPPVCGSGVFDGVNKTNCELIVPIVSVIAYKQAEVWNEFSNIKGFSGVEDTVADGNTIRAIGNQIEISGDFTSVEVYGINGALIYKGKDNVVTVPSAGIYLVHVADKTRKIVVE